MTDLGQLQSFLIVRILTSERLKSRAKQTLGTSRFMKASSFFLDGWPPQLSGGSRTQQQWPESITLVPIRGRRRLRYESFHTAQQSPRGGIVDQFGNISGSTIEHVFCPVTAGRKVTPRSVTRGDEAALLPSNLLTPTNLFEIHQI
jgi:hypothetical protein